MIDLQYTRRQMLQSSVGLAGLTLPTFHQARAMGARRRSAKACIVIFCWGGMSHYESWDPKPDAPSEIRGEFDPIKTATPGIQVCEHIPLLAKHSDKLAIVRSVHHNQGGHQQGMYISLTGHTLSGGRAMSRDNWPSVTAMVSRFVEQTPGAPRAIRLPHSMYDNGTLMAGEYGGWLGQAYDPVLIPTPAGTPFAGVSRKSGAELKIKLNLEEKRIAQRRQLLNQLDRKAGTSTGYDQLDHFRKMAADMLTGSALAEAYNLEKEDPRVRRLYGHHAGGQGMLLARRLVEAGVPVVQVCAGAGDLAGGSGDNWDTHRDHFAKMKKRLLPVFDHSASALLTDLEQRGMLDDTLVVFLTDFGRTPKVNNNGGRDHHPAVYSVALAGGGIQGGQVYGSSDRSGIQPGANACTPADVHATVYKAMGINPRTELTDAQGRPFHICDGSPLPLF